ncbi:MAG: MarR family transcriptional regulator [Clostridia bacterium]|nr:MarR family transcriptional regulator [Clostridia bacterium]
MKNDTHPNATEQQAAYDRLLLKNQLCFPLYAAARKVMRLYTPLLEALHLTYTQYITMLALWEQDGQTVSDLGQRLHLDSGTLTPLLKKMEKQSLVRRKRSTSDERVVKIHLTADGLALRQQALDIPETVASCIRMSLDDAVELKRLLALILDQ